MGLLHWCILAPEGPSSLAAVRFAAPIRVSSIRIFPTGTQPFAHSPDVIAHTDPEAFFLEVFFNAHPILQTNSKEKQRAANALIPTVIAYAGGQVDFTVDMGTEYATRLMIVKGKFNALSMAIYGDIVSEPPPVQKYEPKPLPSVESIPLSRAVDPSNSSDPTLLAKQLLSLIPDSPPLPLVVRLMFCMKPSNEDWELQGFPYLHADLDGEVEEDFDLQTALRWTYRPVQDDTSLETLSSFAVRVASCIGQKNSDQAYHVAKLLSISASQHPDMARTLLQHLDITSIFDVQVLDEDILLFLLDAAANADIARHLNTDPFSVILQEIQVSARVSKATQLVARRLFSRIRGWHYLEDALSNTRGDFNRSSSMLKDLGTEEQSMGIWLESMTIHDDIVTKLGENPVLPVPSNPPYGMNITSHDEYITLVRAYIGVASVLSVFAWTDSIGNDVCREHTLAVLHLWQKVDGYREILNHLLLLRQLTRRLEWISTENDPPRKSGVLAEKVLFDLASDPHAVLHDDLVQTILALKPPLSFIADNERLSMRKISLVAEDGLSAAIEEIMFSSDHPLSLRRLRTLRVSLAIVERELKDSKDEWHVLQAFWEEQDRGIVPRLVELLADVSKDLNGHFALAPPPRMNQTLAEQLFRTADDLMRLTKRIVPAFPMTGRDIRNLTVAVADIFACTDAADMIYAQTSSACMAAQGARQTCLDLVRRLSASDSYADPGRHSAEVVMQTLLAHGGEHGLRDPAYHILQVFTMIDHILPEANNLDGENEPSYWVTSVLPHLLNEIKLFFRRLDTDNQVHFIRTLVKLDNSVIGIGEWLLMQELMYLTGGLQSLLGSTRADYGLILHYQVTLSLHLIADLVVPPSSSSTWCLTSISSTPDLAQALRTCLTGLLDGHYTSIYLQRLIPVLASSSRSFEPDLRFTILLAALRTMQIDPTLAGAFEIAVETLRDLPAESVHSEALRLELGLTLSAFAQHELDSETSTGLFSILEWLADHENKKFTTLAAITSTAFTKLCDLMLSSLSTDKANALSTLRSKFTIDEDEFFTPTPVELVETLDLSIKNLEDLLRNEVHMPSTPKGNKTPDILGVVISPPTAILRSPASTGLTKTYINNDFRQLRQVPSVKQNMSRLPSMHVDVGINSHLIS